MKAIVQRCRYAKCVVEGKTTGEIGLGYMILVGFTHGDNPEKISKMAKKVANLRIFEDEEGKMNRSLLDVKGAILSISQFTLYANPYTGNRPSFTESLPSQEAIGLYHQFNQELRNYSIQVEEGVFGAHMEISLLNDGPVTISLEF